MAGRKDWDPRGPHRFRDLERLASKLIGDGKSPDLFFVTVQGKVIAIAQDFEIARQIWETVSSPMITETTLEDRKVGVLASVQRPEEGGALFLDTMGIDLLQEEGS